MAPLAEQLHLHILHETLAPPPAPSEPGSMAPRPVAQLPEELVEEILLRIPPTDPATLARAAIAQKRWCRLVAGAGFRGRYRALHRAPPMLGFLCDPSDGDGVGFIPASSFRPKPYAADRRHLSLEDTRHGRVLLRVDKLPAGAGGMARVLLRVDELPAGAGGIPGLIVWNPITGHRVALPRPKGVFFDKDNGYWKATVLCAAAAAAPAGAGGSCDHLDCHRGHFTVILIGNYLWRMFSCVYSSQDGAWSEVIIAQNLEAPAMLSRDGEGFDGSERTRLTTMEDGQLGLAVLCKSTLYIMSTDEELGWGRTKIIDLEKCSSYPSTTTTPLLIGFAGDIGLVFLKAENIGILSVDIRSAQVEVVDKRSHVSSIVPYINFCTPAMGVPSKDKKPTAGASRDV